MSQHILILHLTLIFENAIDAQRTEDATKKFFEFVSQVRADTFSRPGGVNTNFMVQALSRQTVASRPCCAPTHCCTQMPAFACYSPIGFASMF